MKICITYNREYFEIKNLFVQPFKDDSRIEIIENVISTTGAIGFGTMSWYESIFSKIKFLVENMKATKDKIICLSDIDIYCGNINKLIEDVKIFENSNFQLAACYENYNEFLEKDQMKQQKQYISVNSGFIVIKNNRSNLRLFEQVLDTDLKGFKYGDQDVINRIICNKKVRCYKLPPQDYICNCYLEYIDSSSIKTSVMYHANCIENYRRKILKIKSFRNIYIALNRAIEKQKTQFISRTRK